MLCGIIVCTCMWTYEMRTLVKSMGWTSGSSSVLLLLTFLVSVFPGLDAQFSARPANW